MKKVFLTIRRKSMSVLRYLPVLFLFLSMTVCFKSSLHAGEVGQASLPDNVKIRGDTSPARKECMSKARTLPMPFIANNGQMDGQVAFYANTFGGTVFVTKEGEIVYVLPNNGSESGVQGFEPDSRMHKKRGQSLKVGPQDNRASCITNLASCTVDHASSLPSRTGLNHIYGFNEFSLFNTIYTATNTSNSSNPILRSIALKETIVGGKIGGITGEQPAVTKVNYFTGNDPSKWKTNVSTYNLVNLGEVYNGIELSLKAYGDNVEKLFCVKPGISPELITVQLDGGKSLQINSDGQLEADTELGTVKFTKPVAYQEVEGKRVEVAVEYTIHGS